jgi:hypothetical protein
VMLREPESFVAEFLDVLRQGEGALERLRDGAALHHRREIEDGKRYHLPFCTALPNLPTARSAISSGSIMSYL